MTTQPSTHLITALRVMDYTAQACRIEEALVPTSRNVPALRHQRENAVHAQRWARARYPGYDHRFPD